MFERYRSVLSAPGCARVFGTALLGRLPQGMSSLAILLLVRTHTLSYTAAGVAVGAYAAASAAASPLQGRLVDRYGRAWVLTPVAAGQAAALVALVLAAGADAGAVVLILLSAVAGSLMPSLAPAVRALLREILIDPDVRESAYAVESVTQELIWITGPLVVAAVIAVTSPADALLLSAVVCVAGTGLFVSSPAVRAGARRPRHHERTRVFAIPALRALLGPIALMGAGLGATEVGIPSLALHAGSRPASGAMLALWSVGSMAGGLFYGSRSWRAPLEVRYRTLLIVAVLCSVPLIAARTVPEGLVCSLLAGLTVAPVFSAQYALIGRAVTPGVETEAFTWVAAALIAGVAAGSALGGAAIAAAGVSGPFLLAAAATLLAAASAVWVGRAERQPA